jgi:hypothetical protein
MAAPSTYETVKLNRHNKGHDNIETPKFYLHCRANFKSFKEKFHLEYSDVERWTILK